MDRQERSQRGKLVGRGAEGSSVPEYSNSIVVGSKGFVETLDAPLRLRLGIAPRTASGPDGLSKACQKPNGLVVLEYGGQVWLDAIRTLRQGDGRALSIVAAVPPRSDDAQVLQQAGVDEVVSWDGRADPILWAIDRLAKKPVTSPSPVEGAKSGADCFPRENGAKKRAGMDAGSDTAAAVAADWLPSPPVASPKLPWPLWVPSAADAEVVLSGALAGQFPRDPICQAALARVLAAASEEERLALGGQPTEVDAALLRSAIALRYRLHLALSGAPTSADAVDQPAAQQLLSEVDDFLAKFKTTMSAAPAGVAPALEPLRHAIVDGGVQLAGAVSRLAPVGEILPVPSPAAVPQASGARVLSNERDERDPSSLRQRILTVALLFSVLAAGGYHFLTWAHRPVPHPMPRITGAPAGLVLFSSPANSARVLIAERGHHIDPVELERFRKDQELKGMAVIQVDPITIVVKPMSEHAPLEGAK